MATPISEAEAVTNKTVESTNHIACSDTFYTCPHASATRVQAKHVREVEDFNMEWNTKPDR